MKKTVPSTHGRIDQEIRIWILGSTGVKLVNLVEISIQMSAFLIPKNITYSRLQIIKILYFGG
jgi:hypothetical protein